MLLGDILMIALEDVGARSSPVSAANVDINSWVEDCRRAASMHGDANVRTERDSHVCRALLVSKRLWAQRR